MVMVHGSIYGWLAPTMGRRAGLHGPDCSPRVCSKFTAGPPRCGLVSAWGALARHQARRGVPSLRLPARRAKAPQRAPPCGFDCSMRPPRSASHGPLAPRSVGKGAPRQTYLARSRFVYITLSKYYAQCGVLSHRAHYGRTRAKCHESRRLRQ